MTRIDVDYACLGAAATHLDDAADVLGRAGSDTPDIPGGSVGGATLAAMVSSLALNAGCVCLNVENAAEALRRTIAQYEAADRAAQAHSHHAMSAV